MTHSLEIRRIGQADRHALFDLVKDFATSFAPDRDGFESGFRLLSDDQSVELWGAVSAGELVGYVLAFHHQTFFANGKITWIEELMVKEGSRRKGIGRALVAHIERRAGEENSKMVALATRRAERFYLAVGYEDSARYFRKKLQI